MFNLIKFIQRSAIIMLLYVLASIQVTADEVTIAFNKVDITTVLESVAEITGKTFIKDPRVQGKMTIIASDPIDSKYLFEVFLSALQVHGFQAVKDGQVYRVLPLSQSYRVPTNGQGGTLTTELIRLKYGNAKDVISSLRPMMSQGAILQAHNPSNSLIITDTVAQIARVKQLVAQLDLEPKSDIEIISLKYVAAADVVKLAKELKLLDNTMLQMSADANENRLVLSGPELSRQRIVDLADRLDSLETETINIDVIYLHYVDAKEVKTIIEGMLNSGVLLDENPSKNNNSKKEYSIQEDVANNAIVIAGRANIIARMRLLIDKLDKPRLQVLIEAVIAEVTQDQARQIGTQLIGSAGGVGGIIDFNSAVATLAGALVIDNGSGPNSAAALANSVGSQGASLIAADVNNNFGALVNALQTNARSNILSTPSILTLDNEEASISVGQEVPFLTGSYVNSNSGVNNPFQTIQREEVGITLKVTPKVNEGDAVRLKIEQESSNLLASASANDVLQQTTAKRTISTNVMVYDGQLLVLGGLKDQSDTISRSKVPILGDIPLLGYLFRSSRKTKVDNILMVFIRPTIMRTKGEAGEVSDRKYNLIQESFAKNFSNLKNKRLIEDFKTYRQMYLLDRHNSATFAIDSTIVEASTATESQ